MLGGAHRRCYAPGDSHRQLRIRTTGSELGDPGTAHQPSETAILWMPEITYEGTSHIASEQ